MEYIIKYTGDILSLGYPTELLDAQFAIMDLDSIPPSRLLEHPQVTSYEPVRYLSALADRSMEAACIPPVQRKNGLGLTGRGVLIGFADSGLDLSHPEFLGEDGASRVVAFWDMTAEGTPPEGFLHGAAYSGEEIAAGLVPAAAETGHGTAVAAIAAGQGGGRRVIVCAAGNEGSGAHHFRGKLIEGGSVDAEFTVSTRRELVYLSLWKNFADEAVFDLTLPNGQSTGPLTEGTRFLRFGSIRVSVFYGVPTHYSAAQEAIFLLEAPPGGLDGLWRLRCQGGRVSNGLFDIWLPTVEEVSDRTAFLQPEPDLTITLPATAMYPISVGGFRPETETVSPFSGRGDQECAGRVLLDLTAPAEAVRSAKAGGGYDVFTGTSMAAPFVSGAAALMMEWGIVQGNDLFLYNQRVKAFLCKGALRSPFLSYPNPQWGYGRLNLCGTMNELVNHLERGL